ncbi:ShlB/FhaC/HecB family hemolysin secretion/activation protein [Trinickia terrae]|uniref:ShlB/FhaC/HecB family hemolysin secretion/activation protein n=1 Tax=Trinickia terrae TaxID=2571161 RepID=A0A4U1I812_9BURK|nr:ShlB/FhaC/HecB family hemolysin secretion/activation protein [Trinickia terrae]TKC89395.1 ShlB/FhaC/HecB family hemolysin secretion/activation protein [Trinickia terrae]
MKPNSLWLASCMLMSGVIGTAGLMKTARAQQAPGLPQFAPPSSGALLRDNPKLTAPDAPRNDAGTQAVAPRADGASAEQASGPAIEVRRIEVEDVPEAARPAVDAVVAPYAGQRLTLAQLREVAAKVTQALDEQGQMLSYVSIPPQKITDGIVKLRVIQGHLESLTLGQNTSHVRDKTLQAYLRQAGKSMDDMSALQDRLLLLGDLPGVGAIVPVLSAGQTPGGTAMTIDTQPASRADVVLAADNSGSSATGRNRLGMQVSANSPLGFGDRFQAVAYVSADALQYNHDGDGGNTTIGRVSYDLPVNGMGTRVGVAASRVDYTLGEPYRDDGRGHANVFSLYASHPLVRSNTRNLNLSVSLDQKEMRDTFLDDKNKRSEQQLGVDLSGDARGALWGMPSAVQYQGGIAYGRLHNPDRFYGFRTDGRFVKLTQSVKLTQAIRSGVYVELAANAQQTSRNLDSAEKMTLGGPNAVRAYSNDTVGADQGVVASATLNVVVPQVPGLTLQAFYDIAQADVAKFNARSTHVEMSGYGVGASYTINKRAILNVSFARPNGHTDLGQRPSGQVWVNTAIRF